MRTDEWPPVSLAAVPGDRIALQLAERVRQLAIDGALRCDVDRLCRLGGFQYRAAVLETRTGGHEALLVPRVEGGFDILVDPSSSTGAEHGRLWRRRLRFRIAHEIGHSFFYDRRQRPARRLLPSSHAEEAFCDLFADALLLPQEVVEQSPSTPNAIVNLADRFDVSIQATARAVARSKRHTSVLGLRPLHRNRADIDAFQVLWSSGFPTEERPERASILTLDPAKAEQAIRLGFTLYRAQLNRLGDKYYLATLQPEGSPG